MLRLLFTCLEVMWFRKGPQDMPGTATWTVAMVLLYMAVGLPLSLISLPLPTALLQVAIDAILLLGFCYLLLGWRGLTQRIPQTMTALAGTGVLFTVLALPAMVSLDAIQTQGGDASVPSLLLMVLIVWNLAVIAQILRQALEARLALGVALALGYMGLSMAIMSLLFPTAV